MPVSKRVLALLLLLATLAGCARSGDGPTTTTTTPPSDVRVVVHRTGGIAGLDDTVTVEPDGHWTATGRRASTRTGQLTDAQRAQLRALTSDPGLRKEFGRTLGNTKCADTFNYTITVGSDQVAFTDCPTDKDLPPVAKAIAKLVMDQTSS